MYNSIKNKKNFFCLDDGNDFDHHWIVLGNFPGQFNNFLLKKCPFPLVNKEFVSQEQFIFFKNIRNLDGSGRGEGEATRIQC